MSKAVFASLLIDDIKSYLLVMPKSPGATACKLENATGCWTVHHVPAMFRSSPPYGSLDEWKAYGYIVLVKIGHRAGIMPIREFCELNPGFDIDKAVTRSQFASTINHFVWTALSAAHKEAPDGT